ncbi:Vacuolar amino acid transporter 5 [Seminavis robusta]|uniref:Vacuolar amino acid transporter 5 n=1 Tax=Seminavis robusta TaxID=568900 RepID=A0A9N8D5B7_9STRA|nr:Vacuolar amino acid transporter 5 [Seminavis robusta]|eukprot:Sro9_g007230.1 Vacuolar amino acid transporter 5 (539) ;mRNA; f:83178-84794
MYGSVFFGSNKDNDDDNGNSRPLGSQISLPVIPPGEADNARSTCTTGSKSSTVGPSPLLDECAEVSKKRGTATMMSCIVNLANTIVGAGMLGLPGAFGGTGYVGGSILIVLGAFFSSMGLWLLSRAAQRAGLPSSFYSVAHAAVPQYTVLIDLAVALKCFGVATGYLITVGDCMVDALDHILLNDKDNDTPTGITKLILTRQFWVVAAVLAVLPISFYKTLDSLKKTSAIALIFVLFLAFGIVAYANGLADPCLDTEEDVCRGEILPFTDISTTISKLPIFVFAFTCHQNIFPVVNELAQRTQQRLNIIIAASIGVALILFYIVATEGYKTFGSMTRGDVLLNYPETGKVTILRICIAIMLSLHYPLQLDPSRRCIKSLIREIQRQWNKPNQTGSNPTRLFHRRTPDLIEQEAEEQEGQPYQCASEESNSHYKQNQELKQQSANDNDDDDDTMFYVITISFLLCSFALAMIVNDLGVILAMVGATGSTLVSYVLPGLIYLKLHPYQDLSKRLAYLQLGLGCLIMPLALYFVVMQRIKT